MSFNVKKNAYKKNIINNTVVINSGENTSTLPDIKNDTNMDISKPLLLPGQKGCYFYTRVSLILDKEKKVNKESFSIDHQDRQITEYCEKYNLVILEKFSDPNISGKNIDDRPGLLNMLSKVHKGIVVICSSVSRLSRDTEDLLCINRTIQSKGGELIILDMPISPSTLQGEMLLSIVGSLATLERKQNNLKISQCMANMSRENKLIKCPRFGYRVVNKQYVENEKEQEIILYVKTLLETEPDMLPGRIAKELADNKYTNKKGNPIHIQTIQSIIREINNPTIQPFIEKQKQEALKNKPV